VSVYKTEEEQVDDLKRWLKSYGPSIAIGIILALGITYGLKFWKKHKTQVADQTSALYQEMLDADKQDNTEQTAKLAQQLKDTYAKSPYAQYASFLDAKEALTQEDYAKAQEDLNWVIDHSKDDNFKAIARLRLARVQISNDQAEEALTTLASLNDEAFAGLVALVQADAYQTLGDTEKAKAAYQLAQSKLPADSDSQAIIQMKLDNLSGTDAAQESAQ
jgi:predicted negative regulator of RcsB-dependent stress response